MFSLGFVLGAVLLLGVSGLPVFGCSRSSPWGPRISTTLVVAGSVVGLVGVGVACAGATIPACRIPWAGFRGGFSLSLDPLSAFFLAPIFVVPALGSIYGLGYGAPAANPGSRRRLNLSYGVLAAAMALVVLAHDAVCFLVAWETMAIAAYFAATAEEDREDVRRTGWVYLVSAHAGALCLFSAFALWRQATGSFALEPATALSPGVAGALFVLIVIGFGFKAGLMPLHIWLPGAHANAPSHVSAVMSGVMLKMGVYGIVRMSGLLPGPAEWWGGALLGLGSISAVVGIAYAAGQQDLKRLLAYSSIENIGIIAMGVGLALLGRSLRRPDWVILGLGAALLHVWNHSLFKSLLFFGAGAVLHATHTRDMNRLGGLAARMPGVFALFSIGAVAICALPPLNGFAGEWLLYLGLFRTLGTGGGPAQPAAAVAAVALAAVGALAVASFVKLLGAVFLGSPRGDIQEAGDPGATMLLPMGLAAAGCIGLGLFPWLASPMLEAAARAWAPLPSGAALDTLAPLKWLTPLGLGLLGLAGVVGLAVRWAAPARERRPAGTWDCGYARPTARMQYTSSSFGQTLVEIFASVLRPTRRRPDLRGPFPEPASFQSSVPDAVLDRLVLPLFRLAGRHLPRVRVLQQGRINLYVLYIVAITVLLLGWGAMGAKP